MRVKIHLVLCPGNYNNKSIKYTYHSTINISTPQSRHEFYINMQPMVPKNN